MDNTLYEELGVARTATPTQIKAAFRNKAKSLHPDRDGGDAELMSRVNVAYEVLSNPKKRAHYDRTGRFGEPTKDDLVRKMVTSVVGACLEKEGNIISNCLEMLHDARAEGMEVINKAKRVVEINRKRLSQVTGPFEGPNLVAEAIEDHIKRAEHALAKALTQMDSLQGSIDMLAGYHSTEREPPPKDEPSLADILGSLVTRHPGNGGRYG